MLEQIIKERGEGIQSKVTIILGTRQRIPIQIGSIEVQQNLISESNRRRGSVARIQTKINIKIRAFIPRRNL